MAGRGEKAENRKREILESFYAVVSEEGLEGASMGKVATRMGIHPSLIVHYFSNKEEMVVALVDRMLSTYEETFLPQVLGIEDPEIRLEATVDAIFGPEWCKLVDPGVFYACYSLCYRNPRVKAGFQRMYSRLRELLSGEIGELVEKGVVVRTDPEKLADLIISLLEGYDLYRGVMEDEVDFDRLARFLKENALAIVRADRAGTGGRRSKRRAR